MKNGSNKRPTKKTTKPKTVNNNAAKSQSKKTDTRISKNVREPKEKIILKDLKKDELLKLGYKKNQIEIIKEGFRVSKTGKVAVNDLKSGRLVWISTEEFKEHTNKFVEKQALKSENRKAQISELLGTPIERTSENILENINTSEQLAEYLKLTKGNLRGKNGKFLSKDQKEKVIKIFYELEHNDNVDFNLDQILKKQKEKPFTEFTAAEIKTDPRTPKDFFYWNLQNNIKENDFGTPKIKIIDFDGNTIYEGKSSAIATSVLNKLNKKMDNLETVIEKLENTRPYFTIPVLEDKVKGIHTGLTIDYSNLKTRLKGDLFEKYKSML